MAVHTTYLPISPDTPYPLGRHREHDDASWNYRYGQTRPARDVDTEWGFSKPVLNQWNTNGCVGNAIMQFFNTDFAAPARALQGVSWHTEGEALNCYHLATIADGVSDEIYPPHDDGTTALGGAKAAQQLGLIDRYEHTFTFDAFRAALQNQPVCVGTVWTWDMFHPDFTGFTHVGDLSDANIAGGHEYLALGIAYSTSRIKFLSSWGPDFGVKGTFTLSFDDFQALLGVQGDVLVLHGKGMY